MNRLKSEAIDSEVKLSSFIEESLTHDLRRLVRSKVPLDEVDDVIQEAAMAIATSKSIPDEASHRRRWSFRIVLNQCALYWRRRAKHSEPIGDSTETLAIEADPLLWLIKQESRQVVDAAVSSLPSDMRDVLMMKYVRQLTYDQLATELRISRDAAQYRCSRAKKALRSLLLQYEDQQE